MTKKARKFLKTFPARDYRLFSPPLAMKRHGPAPVRPWLGTLTENMVFLAVSRLVAGMPHPKMNPSTGCYRRASIWRFSKLKYA